MHFKTTASNILLFYICNCVGISFLKFNTNKDVLFKLYKRDFDSQILNKNDSNVFVLDSLDLQIPTRIFTHGYLSSKKTIEKMRDAYLNAGDFNFVAVDWTTGSSVVNYFVAKSRMKRVSWLNSNCLDKLRGFIMNCRQSKGCQHIGRVYWCDCWKRSKIERIEFSWA